MDIGVFEITKGFDAIGNLASSPLKTISLYPLLELIGGDYTVTVLVKPSKELRSALEFVSLHFAILIRVMACRELLEGETALPGLILLSLLCGGSDMDQGQCQKK